MSNVYKYIVKYMEGEDDELVTSSVPFTLASLQAASGVQTYKYRDHWGNQWTATIDTDKVIDVIEVQQPPDPPTPSM